MSSELNETYATKPPDFLADRYDRIVSIGSGAMGDVYRARDKKLKMDVAVKVLSKQTPSDKDIIRFQREAQAYGKCNHENLVKILDFGLTEASEPFLIMEFFDGENVDDIIIARQAPPRRNELNAWIEIFVQVCRGMEHAHKNGIVHRDIKTRNILVSGLDASSKSEKPVVKIIDFGLAKIEDYAGDATLTKVGAVVGSPLYLSPEQAGGNKADARSDIYSFGCVMYFALTGQLPFRGDTPLATIRGHLKEAPTPLRDISDEVDERLESIVLRCLEKSPDDRYQTMGELEKALLKRLEKGAPDVVSERHNYSSVIDPASSTEQTLSQRKISKQKLVMSLVVVACMFAAVFWLDRAIKEQLQERRTAPGTANAKGQSGIAAQTGETGQVGTLQEGALEPEGDPSKLAPEYSVTDTLARTAFWNDTDRLFKVKISGKMRLSIQPKDLANVTDADLRKINWEKVDRNKYVELDLGEAPKITGSGLQYLPSARIYSLRLARTGIVNSAFDHIAKMPNLEHLALGYTQISLDGLRRITGLKNLRSLQLGFCPRIDDRAVMLIINSWPDLTHLSLADARITRDTIKEIPRLKHLEELSLTDTPANDEDVIALSKTNSLSEFFINHCPITDKALVEIEKMPNLRIIGIYGCQGLTEAACQRLRNKRPDLKLPGEPSKEYVEFYFSDEDH